MLSCQHSLDHKAKLIDWRCLQCFAADLTDGICEDRDILPPFLDARRMAPGA